ERSRLHARPRPGTEFQRRGFHLVAVSAQCRHQPGSKRRCAAGDSNRVNRPTCRCQRRSDPLGVERPNTQPTVILPGGTANVQSGGTASGTTVNSAGTLNLLSGGNAFATVVSGGAAF